MIYIIVSLSQLLGMFDTTVTTNNTNTTSLK
jgi:hypothetical protein